MLLACEKAADVPLGSVEHGPLVNDLAHGKLPAYSFVTANVCHEMHGDFGCPSGIDANKNIAAGDAWLAANLPPLIAYTHTHNATIFLVWDEGDNTLKIPFLALGDHVVPGPSAVSYTHSSLLKTVEHAEIVTYEWEGVPADAARHLEAGRAMGYQQGKLCSIRWRLCRYTDQLQQYVVELVG